MKSLNGRALTPELSRAVDLLRGALIISDDEGELAAACLISAALDQLTGAGSVFDQWRAMTSPQNDPHEPE
ncbi:hypothetical protein WBP07_22505 (plasmid) [Novosphingobium sp. BL-8A]|uniref:hypothetical protein n=1 Tax=Novosphingobium sp. BL-8A TaxID=3127639 RepID=UPI003757F1F5